MLDMRLYFDFLIPVEVKLSPPRWGGLRDCQKSGHSAPVRYPGVGIPLINVTFLTRKTHIFLVFWGLR